ncbi:MAG: hypothetical protein ACRCX2_20230 [Paraclostridium sp.]
MASIKIEVKGLKFTKIKDKTEFSLDLEEFKLEGEDHEVFTLLGGLFREPKQVSEEKVAEEVVATKRDFVNACYRAYIKEIDCVRLWTSGTSISFEPTTDGRMQLIVNGSEANVYIPLLLDHDIFCKKYAPELISEYRHLEV